MIYEDKLQKPTNMMIRNFEKRTKEHIDRVAFCLRKIYETTSYGEELLERAAEHDKSKYGKVEKFSYIWLTEFHRCKNTGIDFQYPPGIEKKVREATLHHITTNRHHPEYHSNPKEMNDIDIIEMVCDWTAMAQELNECGGSAKCWADKNIGSKWEFSEDQIDLIYDTIKRLDKYNQNESILNASENEE